MEITREFREVVTIVGEKGEEEQAFEWLSERGFRSIDRYEKVDQTWTGKFQIVASREVL